MVRAKKTAKILDPTFRHIAILDIRIVPELNRPKGLLFSMKFMKKYPDRYPSIPIDQKVIAPRLSIRLAQKSLSFPRDIFLPNANVSRMNPQANMIPPAKPPPGVRWP